MFLDSSQDISRGSLRGMRRTWKDEHTTPGNDVMKIMPSLQNRPERMATLEWEGCSSVCTKAESIKVASASKQNLTVQARFTTV